MASGNFDPCLRIVLKHEGGYVDHPRDPGGATNLGVTIGTLRDWRNGPATKADVRALTVADVRPIYKARYWNPCGAENMPAGVDLAVFDIAVNSGVGRARPMYARHRKATAVETVRAICDARMTFLRSLRHWDAFGRGWTRRVSDIRARGEAMAGASPGTLRQEAREAMARSDKAAGQTRGAAIAVAPTAAAPAVSQDWAVIGVVAIVAISLGFLALRAWHNARVNHDMSKAYAEVADGTV